MAQYRITIERFGGGTTYHGHDDLAAAKAFCRAWADSAHVSLFMTAPGYSPLRLDWEAPTQLAA